MRLSIAIALACVVSAFSAEAAPACSKYYTVAAKDTCYGISSKTGVSVSKLLAWNSKINSKCSNLQIGEKLCVKPSTVKVMDVTTTKTTTKKTSTKKTSTKKTSTKKTSTKKTSTKKTSTKKTSTKKTSTKKTSTKKTSTKKTSTKKTTTTKKTSTTKKPTTTTTTIAPALSTNGLNYYNKLTIQIASREDFCFFLPSSPGGKADNNGKVDIEAIGNSETTALAFCMNKSYKTPGALTLPTGFVKKAYYFKNETAGYVQVTGSINPSRYELSELDGGGQYDNHGRGAPANSMCYGYRYYVSMVEPDRGDFCTRCCDHYSDCNAGRSTYGCRRVVENGVYESLP